MVRIIVKNNKKLKDTPLEELFDNELAVMIIEYYCLKNNIQYCSFASLSDDDKALDDYYYTKNYKGGYFNIHSLLTKEPPLTDLELQLLLAEYHKGNREAYEELVKRNLRLVYKVARVFAYKDFEDIVQEGLIGLMTAIKTFDYNRCYNFSHYANLCIKNNIIKYKHLNQPIHYSYKEASFINDYNWAHDKLMTKNGVKPTSEEIANFLGWSLTKVHNVETYLYKMESFEDMINQEDEELTDKPYDDEIPLEEQMVKESFSERMQELLIRANLNPKEALILKYHYGFFNDNLMTFQDISDIYGVSKEAIRVMQKRAFIKIKKVLNTESFRDLREYFSLINVEGFPYVVPEYKEKEDKLVLIANDYQEVLELLKTPEYEVMQFLDPEEASIVILYYNYGYSYLTLKKYFNVSKNIIVDLIEMVTVKYFDLLKDIIKFPKNLGENDEKKRIK